MTCIKYVRFWDTDESPNLCPKPKPCVNKKTTICYLMGFAVPVDDTVKIKKENIDKFLDFARELNSVKPEIDVVTKCSSCPRNGPRRTWKRVKELEIGRRIETIQTTALLKSARILRTVLNTRGRIRTIQTTAPLKSARIFSPGDMRKLAGT